VLFEHCRRPQLVAIGEMIVERFADA